MRDPHIGITAADMGIDDGIVAFEPAKQLGRRGAIGVEVLLIGDERVRGTVDRVFSSAK